MPSTRAWRTLRAQILERDQHQCQVNGDGCTLTATEVDHILPVARGGTDAPANLRAACRRCNRTRGANDW